MQSELLDVIIVNLDIAVPQVRYCTLVRYTVFDNLCEFSRLGKYKSYGM